MIRCSRLILYFSWLTFDFFLWQLMWVFSLLPMLYFFLLLIFVLFIFYYSSLTDSVFPLICRRFLGWGNSLNRFVSVLNFHNTKSFLLKCQEKTFPEHVQCLYYSLYLPASSVQTGSVMLLLTQSRSPQYMHPQQ